MFRVEVCERCAIVSLLAFVFIIYEHVFFGLRVVCALGIFMLYASVFSRPSKRFSGFFYLLGQSRIRQDSPRETHL